MDCIIDLQTSNWLGTLVGSVGRSTFDTGSYPLTALDRRFAS